VTSLQPQRRPEVGDILVSMWGYERTNVDFFQVVAAFGKATVSLRRIASEIVAQRPGADTVVPLRDQFLPDDRVDGRRYRLTRNGGVRFDRYRAAGLWNGEPEIASPPEIGH